MSENLKKAFRSDIIIQSEINIPISGLMSKSLLPQIVSCKADCLKDKLKSFILCSGRQLYSKN